MIKSLRVDHRLVHGQVAFTWTHFLGATRIIVINDEIYEDEFGKMALNMAKPAGVKLNVFSVEKALEKIEKIEILSDIIFIIFGSVNDAYKFILGYPKIKELNLGGISKKEGSKQYSEVVYLTENDVEKLKEVEKTGCKLYMQQLPTTKRETISF